MDFHGSNTAEGRSRAAFFLFSALEKGDLANSTLRLLYLNWRSPNHLDTLVKILSVSRVTTASP
jgi:hypothetical protein